MEDKVPPPITPPIVVGVPPPPAREGEGMGVAVEIPPTSPPPPLLDDEMVEVMDGGGGDFVPVTLAPVEEGGALIDCVRVEVGLGVGVKLGDGDAVSEGVLVGVGEGLVVINTVAEMVAAGKTPTPPPLLPGVVTVEVKTGVAVGVMLIEALGKGIEGVSVGVDDSDGTAPIENVGVGERVGVEEGVKVDTEDTVAEEKSEAE